jgi:hypothetical protein
MEPQSFLNRIKSKTYFNVYRPKLYRFAHPVFFRFSLLQEEKDKEKCTG